jgi:glutamate/aspartate transport system substrate-binding protein
VPVRFSIDLCLDIARDITTALNIQSLPIKYLAVNARTRFLVTEQGLADIVCGTTSVTVARMREVDFSMITFVTGARLMVPKNSPYKTIKDVTAKPIGVIGNTTSECAVRKAATVAKVPLKPYHFKNRDRALLAKLLQSRAYRGRYKLVGNLLSYDPYVLILPRNDSRFRYLVNKKLAELYRTRKILKYHDRWFRGINPAIAKLYAYTIAVQGIPEK